VSSLPESFTGPLCGISQDGKGDACGERSPAEGGTVLKTVPAEGVGNRAEKGRREREPAEGGTVADRQRSSLCSATGAGHLAEPASRGECKPTDGAESERSWERARATVEAGV